MTTGDRAFSVAGPRLWNNLPLSLRSAGELLDFKSLLKTIFLNRRFSLENTILRPTFVLFDIIVHAVNPVLDLLFLFYVLVEHFGLYSALYINNDDDDNAFFLFSLLLFLLQGAKDRKNFFIQVQKLWAYDWL